MVRTSAPLLLCAALAGAVVACEPQQQAANPLQYTEDARKAYDKAVEAFLDKDWEAARTLFQEVKRKYAYTRYARLAELRLADIDFEQEKFGPAITEYKAFSHDHRTDESVPYARYRVCKALYAQISDTILLPPQEERDQAAAIDARRELNAFVLDYPDTKWTKEAKFMLLTVTSRLVRHELYVARYYLKKDSFEAAKKRVQYALREYEGSGLEPEEMVLLAETYMKMKQPAEAREVLRTVLEVYPQSPFVKPAREFLAQADAEIKADPSLATRAQ